MFTATDVTTLGQRELGLLSPCFSNPHLRGLIISRGDKVLFNRIISEFPISRYTRESQLIEFPSGGYVYVAPFWAEPISFFGFSFNLIAIEGPYPDPYVEALLHRLIPQEGEGIQPQLYYDGQPRIAY